LIIFLERIKRSLFIAMMERLFYEVSEEFKSSFVSRSKRQRVSHKTPLRFNANALAFHFKCTYV